MQDYRPRQGDPDRFLFPPNGDRLPSDVDYKDVINGLAATFPRDYDETWRQAQVQKADSLLTMENKRHRVEEVIARFNELDAQPDATYEAALYDVVLALRIITREHLTETKWETVVTMRLQALTAFIEIQRALITLGKPAKVTRIQPLQVEVTQVGFHLINDKAVQLEKQGKMAAALEFYEEALEFFKHADQILSDFNEYIIALRTFGDKLAKAKQYEKALQVYHRAQELCARDDDAYFIHNANVQYSQGDVLIQLGRLEDALNLFQLAEAAHREAFGEKPRLGLLIWKRVRLLERLHRYDEALSLYDEIQRMTQQDATIWAPMLHQKGHFLIRSSTRYDEAFAMMIQAEQLWRDVQGEHNRTMIGMFLARADLLHAVGRTAEAQTLGYQGYLLAQQTLGDQDKDTMAAKAMWDNALQKTVKLW